MGGSITVTSQLGVGSTFVITLPFEIAPSPEQTPDAHAAPDISIAGCRLLLVEDNALNAEIAQILLTDEGADRNRRHGWQTGCGDRAEQSTGHIRRGSHGCDDACDERH